MNSLRTIIETVKTNDIKNFAGRISIDAFAKVFDIKLQKLEGFLGFYTLKCNNVYGRFQWPTRVGHSRTMNMIVTMKNRNLRYYLWWSVYQWIDLFGTLPLFRFLIKWQACSELRVHVMSLKRFRLYLPFCAVNPQSHCIPLTNGNQYFFGSLNKLLNKHFAGDFRCHECHLTAL